MTPHVAQDRRASRPTPPRASCRTSRSSSPAFVGRRTAPTTTRTATRAPRRSSCATRSPRSRSRRSGSAGCSSSPTTSGAASSTTSRRRSSPTTARARTTTRTSAQAGFRVPTVLASPYARPGYVDHTLYDHTSILRFLEWRFLGAPPRRPGRGHRQVVPHAARPATPTTSVRACCRDTSNPEVGFDLAVKIAGARARVRRPDRVPRAPADCVRSPSRRATSTASACSLSRTPSRPFRFPSGRPSAASLRPSSPSSSRT